MSKVSANKRLRALKCESVCYGKLPKGCSLCKRGVKLVLLVTGKCNRNCFYCPLSEHKKGRDVIYANELRVKKDEDIIHEAKLIGALGTGITGGDPFLVPNRTLRYINLLKREFGLEHHIHLYTGGLLDVKYLTRLADAHLDEIRFHIPLNSWRNPHSKYYKMLKYAVRTTIDVGVEVPALPGYSEALIALAKNLDALEVKFLNLNELEFSDTNYEKLVRLRYKPKSDISNAVAGSEKIGLELTRACANLELNLTVHYCSSRYKDAVQLRNRLKNRAKNVVQAHEIITRDATLLKGIIELPNVSNNMLRAVRRSLIRKFTIPSNLIIINYEKQRIELAPWILHELAPELSYNCFIIEELPSANRLEVEREPLK
jgi:hypothetical protein